MTDSYPDHLLDHFRNSNILQSIIYLFPTFNENPPATFGAILLIYSANEQTDRYTDETRMWPMPNVMAALPNIVGALSSTPQSMGDTHY